MIVDIALGIALVSLGFVFGSLITFAWMVDRRDVIDIDPTEFGGTPL